MKMTNLKVNYPFVEDEEQIIRDYIVSRNSQFSELLRFPSLSVSDESLAGVKKQLKVSSHVFSDTSSVIECNGGNHALSCLLQVMKVHHRKIITEPFTYPGFKTLALANGFQLHASEFDEHGLTIAGLEKTIHESKATAIYLQPTIHNPTCVVMPLARRIELADLARRKNITLIEDDAYRFLHPDPPASFLDLLPENTFHVFSLSKPFNPLVKTAYLISPRSYTLALMETVRLTSSGHSSLLSSLAAFVCNNDSLEKIIFKKQRLGESRQRLLTTLLPSFPRRTYPTSFHAWIELPEKTKCSDLLTYFSKQSILLADSADFSIDSSNAFERYLRISLSMENEAVLENALTALGERIRA